MFLDETVDLIGQASSNPLLIFCLCNFIIAILFLSGFRSVSTSQDQCSCNFRQLATAAAPTPAQERIEVARPPMTKEEDGSNDQQNQSNDDRDNDDHSNNNNDCKEDKDGDDELRKRVEEFIEKINRRWQAEKMMQGCLTPLPTAV